PPTISDDHDHHHHHHHHSDDPLQWLRDSVPGEPGDDYPIFGWPIPQTAFTCVGKVAGFYADVETRCQVFHVCNIDGSGIKFLCPNGTIFNQEHFTCEWWNQVSCGDAESFFNLNNEIGVVPPESPYQPDRPRPVQPRPPAPTPGSPSVNVPFIAQTPQPPRPVLTQTPRPRPPPTFRPQPPPPAQTPGPPPTFRPQPARPVQTPRPQLPRPFQTPRPPTPFQPQPPPQQTPRPRPPQPTTYRPPANPVTGYPDVPDPPNGLYLTPNFGKRLN
ncbi:extensin-like, partial [Penaeus monodon]|uniref:extensin-like n=1 Tax=Penaeus monodon TaxID=6687 RepID=UPI0018A7AEF4